MSLYEKCLVLALHNEESAMKTEKGEGFSLSVPEGKQAENESYALPVYYISDIHLEHHIIKEFPNGATDSQIEAYIDKLVSELLTDEIVLYNKGQIILFAGDIASEFKLSVMFYSRFVQMWDAKNRENYEKVKAVILPLINEQKTIKKELSNWEKSHAWVKNAVKDLLEYSDKRVSADIKKLVKRNREIDEQLWAVAGYNYDRFLKKWAAPKKRVVAILGNHEVRSFDSLNECINAYQTMLNELGIIFLNNQGCRIPALIGHKVAIIGGIGFAGNNAVSNANSGIYCDTINREQEIALSKEWEEFYRRSTEMIKQNNEYMIVLSHNPPHDWSTEPLKGNCAYFYGHNHQNTSYFIEDTNTSVFADNQVGYTDPRIELKKANVFVKANPFAHYSDGVHVVSAKEYELFNWFCGIYRVGTKRIEKSVEDGNTLYMIKEKGYSGFFVTCETQKKGWTIGTYICAGGMLNKINDITDIEYFQKKFSKMINAYLAIFFPYRNAMERIAYEVKAIGGWGKIHGSIIDVDFFNHILLNSFDGKITFYNSPVFGYAQSYSSLFVLLSIHRPELLEQYSDYVKQIEGGKNSIVFVQNSNERLLESIDIKNSPYSDSKKISQVQRLFDVKVLRVWNELIINETEEEIVIKE